MLNSITSLHARRIAPPTGAAVLPDARFDAQARRFLLRQRGIAEGVVAGLEALGITSLEQFVAIGAEQVCQRMSATHGFNVWGNRRRALCAAIEAARQVRPVGFPIRPDRPWAERTLEAKPGQANDTHA